MGNGHWHEGRGIRYSPLGIREDKANAEFAEKRGGRSFAEEEAEENRKQTTEAQRHREENAEVAGKRGGSGERRDAFKPVSTGLLACRPGL